MDPITRRLIEAKVLSARSHSRRFVPAVEAHVRAEYRRLVRAVERDKLGDATALDFLPGGWVPPPQMSAQLFDQLVDRLVEDGMFERWKRVWRVVLDGDDLHLFPPHTTWLDRAELEAEWQTATNIGEHDFAAWLVEPRPFRLLLRVRRHDKEAVDVQVCLAGDDAPAEAIEAAYLSGGLAAVLAMGTVSP